MPVSPPSAALTCHGLKWRSKNARTAPLSVATTLADAAHGVSQIARVAGAVTSAAQPARNAGQISATLSSDQPGSAVHATAAYFAGSDGVAACGGVEGAGGFAAGFDGSGGRGVVAHPVTARTTASSIAANEAERVARGHGRGSEERDKMLWFFLEALTALLIALAIVGWTMGFGRRKPPDKPGGTDGDNNSP